MKWKILQIIAIFLLVFGLFLSSEQMATAVGIPIWLFAITGKFKAFLIGFILFMIASYMERKQKKQGEK